MLNQLSISQLKNYQSYCMNKEEHKNGEDCSNYIDKAVRVGRAHYLCPICGKDVSMTWYLHQLALHNLDDHE